MSKYAFFSGSYFLVLRLNTGKYGPEKSPYLDIFHAMSYWVCPYCRSTEAPLSSQSSSSNNLSWIKVLHDLVNRDGLKTNSKPNSVQFASKPTCHKSLHVCIF